MGKDTLSFEIWIFRNGQPVHDFDRKMFYSFKKKYVVIQGTMQLVQNVVLFVISNVYMFCSMCEVMTWYEKDKHKYHIRV